MEDKILEENIEERNYTQEIFDLIRKTKNSKLLAQTLTNYHDNDIADALHGDTHDGLLRHNHEEHHDKHTDGRLYKHG